MKNIVKFLFFSVIFIGVSGPAMAEDTPVPAVVETETETETETVVGDVLTVTSQDYVDTLFEKTHSAANITRDTLDTARLNVGREANTVAAGDDGRFDTMVIGQPDKEAEEGRVLVWVEP